MNHKIPTDEDCFICGDELVALSDSTTGVTDGDEVICEACGAEAWISADEDGAGVSYDEMSAHNVLCAERYEANERLATRDATIEKLRDAAMIVVRAWRCPSSQIHEVEDSVQVLERALGVKP